MCRIDPNGANFLVADTAGVSQYATESGKDNTRQNLDGMTFHSTTPTGGAPADQINVRFSIGAYTRWDYDPTSGRYLRFQDNQEDETTQNEVYVPLIDRLTGEQLGAENIVVLFIPHLYAFREGKTEIVDIQLNGNGQAVAFRDGLAYLLNWSRSANTDRLQLTWPDGRLYAYKPGVTWYQVIGQGSVTTTTEGSWRFTFRLP